MVSSKDASQGISERERERNRITNEEAPREKWAERLAGCILLICRKNQFLFTW